MSFRVYPSIQNICMDDNEAHVAGPGHVPAAKRVKLQHNWGPATSEVQEMAESQSVSASEWPNSSSELVNAMAAASEPNIWADPGAPRDDDGSNNEEYTDNKAKSHAVLGACLRCKNLKVKCESITETDPCKRCLNGGHDCIPPGRKKRRTPPKREHLLNQIREQAEYIEKLMAQLKEGDKARPQPSSRSRAPSPPSPVLSPSNTSGSYPPDPPHLSSTLTAETIPFNSIAGLSLNNKKIESSSDVEDIFRSSSVPDQLAIDVSKILCLQEPWKLLCKMNLSPSWASCIMNIVQNEFDRFAWEPYHGEYGRKCMRLLRKMAQRFGVLPPSFILSGLAPVGNHAVCGGGFSDIWKGKLGDQDVCIKVLRVFTTTERREELVKEFCHEAIIWGQFKHPNILPFLGVSFDLFNPSFCLVSPWLENGNILQFLERNPTYNRMIVIREVAEGLKYLHTFNPPVVHGDIRGANIIVTSDLRCCLADFGLAAVVESQIFTTTRADSIRGTTRWMAPEVLLPPTSDKPINTAPFRDIYAFACTVLELCTGQVPFHEDRLDITVAHKVLRGQRPQRPSSDIWFPDELWDLVQMCWKEDPTTRPTAAKVVELIGPIEKSLSKN